MKNDELRKEVKSLKAFQDITYKEIAEYLEIRVTSFYSWLKGQYNLGEAKQKRLEDIISTVKEG